MNRKFVLIAAAAAVLGLAACTTSAPEAPVTPSLASPSAPIAWASAQPATPASPTSKYLPIQGEINVEGYRLNVAAGQVTGEVSPGSTLLVSVSDAKTYAVLTAPVAGDDLRADIAPYGLLDADGTDRAQPIDTIQDRGRQLKLQQMVPTGWQVAALAYDTPAYHGLVIGLHQPGSRFVLVLHPMSSLGATMSAETFAVTMLGFVTA